MCDSSRRWYPKEVLRLGAAPLRQCLRRINVPNPFQSLVFLVSPAPLFPLLGSGPGGQGTRRPTSCKANVLCVCGTSRSLCTSKRARDVPADEAEARGFPRLKWFPSGPTSLAHLSSVGGGTCFPPGLPRSMRGPAQPQAAAATPTCPWARGGGSPAPRPPLRHPPPHSTPPLRSNQHPFLQQPLPHSSRGCICSIALGSSSSQARGERIFQSRWQAQGGLLRGVCRSFRQGEGAGVWVPLGVVGALQTMLGFPPSVSRSEEVTPCVSRSGVADEVCSPVPATAVLPRHRATSCCCRHKAVVGSEQQPL